MKTKFFLLTTLTSMLFLSGCYTCYVSDIESYYFTKNCQAKHIMIMSCQESGPADLNKNLCEQLDNLFKLKGFVVTEYCPLKFDSVEFSKIMLNESPEFMLCIQPQKHMATSAKVEKKLPYRIEALYRRDSGKISSVFLGKIDISYLEAKKVEILKDASEKIYAAIVDNNILK